ncbi:MAG: zinc ribbon domain-containing protein [Candidatus Neomarinimicrobiota bacterium]|nr:zinc ribbon domain-containing protein [Candidatus Neomarinimicrobiota bacterium]
MNKYITQIIISCLFTLVAQSSPFKSYDVVIYPEYYFSGVMAEIEGEVIEDRLPLNIKILTPSNTDSIFYVSGSTENPQVQDIILSKSSASNYIEKSINETKFRIFIFYRLTKKGTERSGDFTFQINYPINDAHIVVQEPLVAKNFIFSERQSEDFKDQHGISFKRIHINNYISNSKKTISFSYDNPTQDISINSLQNIAASNQSASSEINNIPIRHKLPLWQPLLVLGVVSVVVGVMFYSQTKKEASKKPSTSNKGRFCTDCGKQIKSTHKFCANCGGKL